MKLQFVMVTNCEVLAISYVQRTENILLYVPFNDCIMYLLVADIFSSVQFSGSVMSDSSDPMDCSTPGLPVHHQLPEFTQTHAH